MARITVIIPTRNRQHLLARALRSVLSQTFDDFDVVVVDDGSQDSTPDVVNAFQDPRIRYLRHEEPRGVAFARNTALAHATGEYCALLDDDDEWLCDKLRVQLEYLDRVRPTVDVLYSGYCEIRNAGVTIVSGKRVTADTCVYTTMLSQGYLAPTSSFVLRRECFARVGYFDPAFRYGEDFDMWARIARAGFRFDCIEASLVRIHYQPNGITADYAAMIAGAERLLAKYAEFYATNSRVHGAQLHRLGTLYCLCGNMRKGRRAFAESMRTDPRSAKTYASIVLSLLGTRAMVRSYALRNSLSDVLSRGVVRITRRNLQMRPL